MESRKTFPPNNDEEMASADDKYCTLKTGYDELARTINNFSTEKLSAEVTEIVGNVSLTDCEGQQYTWESTRPTTIYGFHSKCEVVTNA